MKWFIASYDLQRSDQNTIKDQEHPCGCLRILPRSLDRRVPGRPSILADWWKSAKGPVRCDQQPLEPSTRLRDHSQVYDKLADVDYISDTASEMPPNLALVGKGTDKTLVAAVYFAFACLNTSLTRSARSQMKFLPISTVKLCLVHFIASVVKCINCSTNTLNSIQND